MEPFDFDRPKIFPASLVSDWPIFQEWIDPNSNASEPRLNYDYLKNKFGKEPISAINTLSKSSFKYEDMQLSEFFNLIQSSGHNAPGDGWYLKDWHFARDHATQSHLYSTPHPFQDDWLNEYALFNNLNDYRFFYLGADKSRSLLHADVFRSHSWSCNVVGVKDWLLFPPEQESFLLDKFGNRYLEDVECSVDESLFPYYCKTEPIRLRQHAGETIFVPSNWFHQVTNIGVTLSINHNYFNATNVHHVAGSLLQAGRDVEESLVDLLEPPVSLTRAEYHLECEKLLKQHYGMSKREFIDILLFKKNQSHICDSVRKLIDSILEMVIKSDHYLEDTF